MASMSLANGQSYQAFFHEGVLTNLRYWHSLPEVRAAHSQTLNREWEGIVRAILFAVRIDRAWPAIHSLIEALAPFMERTGRWEIWQTVLSCALDLAHQVGDLAGQVTVSALQARLFQRQSRFKESVATYRRTIRLARRVGDAFNEARACSNLGYYYVEHGRWQRAEALCRHALAIFERLDSDHGRAHTENHLGVLYTRQRRWELAQQYLERACERWQTMGDNHSTMRGFINLGLLYIDTEYPVEALSYLNKALYQAEFANEKIEVARIYNNIAIAYRLKGEPKKAEFYGRRAKEIFRDYFDTRGLAEAQDNLGLACLDQQKWVEAETHLVSALSYWRSLANEFGEIRNMTYLVDYEIARGDKRKAATRLNELKRRIAESKSWPREQ